MFIDSNFIYRGKSSSEFNVQIVTESSDVLNYFGLTYSRDVSKEDIAGGYKYIQTDGDTEEFTLNLALLDDNDEPIPWNDSTYNRICDWLISNEFEQFISYDNLDLIYYVMVTRIKQKMTYNKLGWIEVTFKPLDNKRYKAYKVEDYVYGSKLFTIFNESKEVIEPLITIQNLGTENNIIDVNDFSISGLEENELVYIDNYMTNVMNQDHENRLYLCNRRWVRLAPGENQVLVKGDCGVTIYCEFPMK